MISLAKVAAKREAQHRNKNYGQLVSELTARFPILRQGIAVTRSVVEETEARSRIITHV